MTVLRRSCRDKQLLECRHTWATRTLMGCLYTLTEFLCFRKGRVSIWGHFRATKGFPRKS